MPGCLDRRMGIYTHLSKRQNKLGRKMKILVVRLCAAWSGTSVAEAIPTWGFCLEHWY